MNLVKWFRKNNTKIMAVVVIVLMVGFIGGSALSYLLNPGKGDKEAMGYAGSRKIRYYDREVARQELEIMQQLGVPRVFQRLGIGGLVMSQLLFPNERMSGDMAAAAQQAIQQNGYRISNRQLADVFKDTAYTPEVLWLLLRDEAQAAGMYYSPEQSRQTLVQLLDPQNGMPGYSLGMQAVVNRYRIPEEQILKTFGRLISVFQYADLICANENLTEAELRHLVSWEGEGLDTEFVQFKASDFADKKATPTAAEMQAQFEKYKGTPAGAVSETNPFGFGYKLPDRVQMEYLVVKLDDVLAAIKKPTQEDAEKYYQQNRESRYTTETPTDPNNPKSPTKKETKSFSEVSDEIYKQLTQERVVAKAEQILTEAKNVADVNVAAATADANEPDLKTLEKNASHYDVIAQDLTRKYGVRVISGRTGMITPTDIQSDKQLSRLRLTSSMSTSLSLAQALFSVKALGDRATILLSAPTTRMYSTIGPLQDPMVAVASQPNQIMAVARVINAEKAAEPAGLDVSYSTKTLALDNTKADANSVYSVKDQVAKDLRVLAAWDKTKAKAQEFVELSAKEGWDKAAARFNDLYGKDIKKDPNDPNVFRVDSSNGLRHVSEAQLEAVRAQLANTPNGPSILNRIEAERLFSDRLYSLVPADANTVSKPLVLEFKPGQVFYAIKTITVRRVNQQQFQDTKNRLAYSNELTETQSLMMVHFDPQSIVKRLKFKYADADAGRRVVTPSTLPEDEF